MSAGVLEVGARIGNYLVLGTLGAGAMGTVYRAHDERLDREVALKVLTTEGDNPRRLLREARAASALNHPNVCTVYDVLEDGARALLVMELVEGTTLADQIGGRALAAERVRGIGAQIAEGLAHAHRRGVVHRDLKCANVKITPEGTVKILDFGIAVRPRGEHTATMYASATHLPNAASQPGTLPYMAPELLRGEPASPASDVWALGVILVEMATGTLPFAGKTPFEMSAAILAGARRPLPSGTDAELRAAIERCLAPRASDRWPDAGALAVALRPGTKSPTPGGTVDQVDRAAIRALAVLPLENLSGDPSQEYFADGMTDELIGGLTRLRAVRVISRTSVMSYKGRRKPLPEIADELDVDAVLEGTVRRAGDHVRINVQLVHARTDTPLWTEQFDRDLRNVLELQSDVARAVAEQIRLQLPKTTTSGTTVNPEAFEACLRGRAQWQTRLPEALLRAIVNYRKAIDLDPRYPLAFSGLADAYNIANFHHVLPPNDSAALARGFAEKALELDPGLAEGWAALAYEQLYYQWDWDEAERSFRKSSELNPNYGFVPLWLANLLAARGQSDEALASCDRALVLDPLSPAVAYGPVWVLWHASRFEEMLERARIMQQRVPNWHLSHLYLACALGELGKHEEARREMERGLEMAGRGPFALGLAGALYARIGDVEKARAILREMDQRETSLVYTPAMLRAYVHAGLGEIDVAFAQLERAVEERSHLCIFLDVEPRLGPLRADPRFEDVRRRVGV